MIGSTSGRTLWVLLALAVSIASKATAETDKEYDPPENYPAAVEQLTHSSDVFAAFLIAYEADRAWFKKEQGVDLTPEEFVRRHQHVFITRLDNGQFDIQMGPEAIEKTEGRPIRIVNPGRRYIIDARTLTVIDAFFDR